MQITPEQTIGRTGALRFAAPFLIPGVCAVLHKMLLEETISGNFAENYGHIIRERCCFWKTLDK